MWTSPREAANLTTNQSTAYAATGRAARLVRVFALTFTRFLRGQAPLLATLSQPSPSKPVHPQDSANYNTFGGRWQMGFA
jgi:hypothetical protein